MTWTQEIWHWLGEWVSSPGFAGLTALVAAAVTFMVTQQKHRRDTWWERTQWALDYLLGHNSSAKQRGASLAAVDALQASSLAKRPEQDFVSAVLDAVLDTDQSHVVQDDVDSKEASDHTETTADAPKLEEE